VAGDETPGGADMFNEALAWAGGPDNLGGIGGSWTRGKDGDLADNLDSFNAGIQNMLTPEEAALNTFTGKMAARAGFTRPVFVSPPQGPPGEYTKVQVIFYRA
jgi:hypothetical protein